MSDITPLGRPNAAGYQPKPRNGEAHPTVNGNAARGKDSVELSRAAQLLSQIGDVPDVRQGLVDRIKAEIAGGTYETDEKIDAAVDAMVDELG